MSESAQKLMNRKYYINQKEKEKQAIQLPETTPEVCQADLLPPWKEACPTPEDMDDDGAKALAAAIIARTAEDYYRVCHLHEAETSYGKDENGNEMVPDSVNALCTRHMIEQFIDESCLFDALTNIDRETFKHTIQNLRKKNIPLPRVTDAPPPAEKKSPPTSLDHLEYYDNYYDPFSYYY